MFCGLSGSGKSSLAFDTLYAEGQRRYIETFSAYTRQFLERLEKPAAERIDGIPPAIAVASRGPSRSSRSTVGTATETNDYLRLLLAKIGRVFCQSCGREVRRDTRKAWPTELERACRPARVTWSPLPSPQDAGAPMPERLAAALREDGFLRVIVGERTVDARAQDSLAEAMADGTLGGPMRTWSSIGSRPAAAATAACEIRWKPPSAQGDGRAFVFVEPACRRRGMRRGLEQPIDGEPWRRIGFSTRLRCDDCQREYPTPEPRLFSFNSPLGRAPSAKALAT